MDADRGTKLMHHLAGESSGSHVMITTSTGEDVLLNKHEIKKVIPAKSGTGYKTPAQLGMPDLSANRKKLDSMKKANKLT